MEFKLLSEYLRKYGIEITSKQKEQFCVYYEKLIRMNRSFNLTSITGFDEVEKKHFIDSVAVVSFLNLNEYNTLIDIGSGAGFPGVPLKILFPHLRVVLVESLNKRVNFLNSIISDLMLPEINAVHARAEELARQQEYREKFDLCVSRAVARLASLSELCIPFLRIGGLFLPYKSFNIEKELLETSKALKMLGGRLIDVPEVEISNENNALYRKIPRILKEIPTPFKYPRRNGLPRKKPIL